MQSAAPGFGMKTSAATGVTPISQEKVQQQAPRVAKATDITPNQHVPASAHVSRGRPAQSSAVELSHSASSVNKPSAAPTNTFYSNQNLQQGPAGAQTATGVATNNRSPPSTYNFPPSPLTGVEPRSATGSALNNQGKQVQGAAHAHPAAGVTTNNRLPPSGYVSPPSATTGTQLSSATEINVWAATGITANIQQPQQPRLEVYVRPLH
jgi:hypothetical protein